MKGAPAEAVGGAAGLAVGLQHQHLQPVAAGDGGGAEAPQATANDDQIRHRPSRSRQRASRGCRPVRRNLQAAQRP